ncbi:hypothetical protein [Streptomyces adustus]
MDVADVDPGLPTIVVVRAGQQDNGRDEGSGRDRGFRRPATC